MQVFELRSLDSPLGVVLVVRCGGRLRAVDFSDCEPRMREMLARHHGPFELRRRPGQDDFCRSLHRYFAGDLTALEDLPADTRGTPFQESVWRVLREIPAGTTWTYGQVAARLGSPGACRAVGLANARNPVALVVPCHRVIGAGGSLTGYAGGVERKRWLLRHEGRSPLA